jgi:uncharacterized protein
VRRFIAIYIGMLLVAAALGRWLGVPSLFTPPPSQLRLLAPLAAAVALALLVVEVGRRLEAVPWYREMGLTLKRMLTSHDLLGPTRPLDASTAFVVALYSSVGEEALFRGVVQPWLAAGAAARLDLPVDAALPAAAGVVGSTLVFALLHPPILKELRPWTAFALLVGVLFGALAAVSGSLLAPIVCHLLINWLNMMRLGKLE